MLILCVAHVDLIPSGQKRVSNVLELESKMVVYVICVRTCHRIQVEVKGQLLQSILSLQFYIVLGTNLSLAGLLSKDSAC